MPIWNRDAEALPRDRMEALQLERLRACVARVLAAVPPFAARLRDAGVRDARDIASLDDLHRLPFTSKSDLRDHYPFGVLAVPREQVIRVHASSGTRGKPTVASYTRDDLAVWGEVMARCLIPGAANLRLPRAVGARLARQAILSERGFAAASAEGRLLCDEVVPAGSMDAASERAVSRLTGAGVVSAAANRKALRIAEEPLDTFRRYMALYAREQAECHYSPALIRNLEQHWNARRRTP